MRERIQNVKDKERTKKNKTIRGRYVPRSGSKGHNSDN